MWVKGFQHRPNAFQFSMAPFFCNGVDHDQSISHANIPRTSGSLGSFYVDHDVFGLGVGSDFTYTKALTPRDLPQYA